MKYWNIHRMLKCVLFTAMLAAVAILDPDRMPQAAHPHAIDRDAARVTTALDVGEGIDAHFHGADPQRIGKRVRIRIPGENTAISSLFPSPVPMRASAGGAPRA